MQINLIVRSGIRSVIWLFVLSLKFSFISLAQEVPSHLDWSKVESIPLKNSAGKSVGVAAHFSGIHNDVLIIAGGTNFLSERNPWDGGIKKWHNDIYVLKRRKKHTAGWMLN